MPLQATSSTVGRPSSGPRVARAAVALIYLVGGVAGARYGFDFGVQIGGMPMGVVTGLTSAMFCTILVSGAVEQVRRLGGTRA